MTYIEKVLKHFHMDNAYPFSILMVIRSLNAKKNLFQLLEEDEEILGPEVPYLSVVGALMYKTKYNFYNQFIGLIKRLWNGDKHIL